MHYGDFGGGMNFAANEYDFELSASLVNFFIEHTKTNLGIEITPLKYTANFSIDTQSWNQGLYFLNGNLYWNPFDIKNIILGPFASINYFKIENWNALHTGSYVFSAGLRFLLRTYIADLGYPFHIIETELGYKNDSGRHGFYFDVNFDITVLAGFFIVALQSMAPGVAEANREYEKQIQGSGPFIPKEPKQPTLPFQ